MSLNILQICRLRSELDVVRGNTKVMSEMLTEMVPGQEEASDYELLQASKLLFLSTGVKNKQQQHIFTSLSSYFCHSFAQELNRTCRAMQQRIVELISCVSNEAVTEELLHVNDDLNNIFLRYERFVCAEHFPVRREACQLFTLPCSSPGL